MCKILFVIGEPGCGKTTAIRTIAERSTAPVLHFCAVSYLCDLVERDTRHRCIPVAGSFEVVDFSLFSETYTALFTDLVQKQDAYAEVEALLCVEMPQQDFIYAPTNLASLLLEEASIICIESSLEDRIARIYARVETGEGHLLPERVSRTRYAGDTALLRHICAEYDGVYIINNGSRSDFLHSVDEVVVRLLTTMMEHAIL